jgi:hypothetical protein
MFCFGQFYDVAKVGSSKGKVLPNFGNKLNPKVILLKTSFYKFLAPTSKNVKEIWGFFLNFGQILAVENLKKHLFYH